MDVDGLDRAAAARLAREREIQCTGQLGAALIGGVLAVVVAGTLPDSPAADGASSMVWAVPGGFVLLAAAQAVARRGWRRVGVLLRRSMEARAIDRVSARTSFTTMVLFVLGLVVLLPSAPTTAVLVTGDGSWWRLVLVLPTLLLAVFGLAGARSLVVDLRQARQGPPARG